MPKVLLMRGEIIMKLKKLAAAVSALLLASGTASAMPVATTADAAEINVLL